MVSKISTTMDGLHLHQYILHGGFLVCAFTADLHQELFGRLVDYFNVVDLIMVEKCRPEFLVADVEINISLAVGVKRSKIVEKSRV
jgi:hypothetical protein